MLTLSRTQIQTTKVPIVAIHKNRDSVVDGETMRWYFSSFGSKRLLDKDEEFRLAIAVKQLITWQNGKKALETGLGREPTQKEWAMNVGFSGSNESLDDFEKQLRLFHLCKECMITRNMKLVVSVAKKYENKGVNILDLIQEGSLGLIKAVEKFDTERNCRFSTFAYYWIKQAITRFIADFSRPIRIPVYMSMYVNSIERTRRIFHLENGFSPTDLELAGALGISESKLRRALDSNRLLMSLDDPCHIDTESNGKKARIDVIQDKISVPSNVIQNSQLQDAFYNVITNVLNTQEREILFLKYGLMGRESRTIEQISVIFGCPKEVIQRIHLRSMRRLRNTPEKNKLLTFSSGCIDVSPLYEISFER